MKAKVMKVKGDRKAGKAIEKMTAKGWQLQNQTTRKARYSLMAGLFTRKQIHTLTFVKGEANA